MEKYRKILSVILLILLIFVTCACEKQVEMGAAELEEYKNNLISFREEYQAVIFSFDYEDAEKTYEIFHLEETQRRIRKMWSLYDSIVEDDEMYFNKKFIVDGNSGVCLEFLTKIGQFDGIRDISSETEKGAVRLYLMVLAQDKGAILNGSDKLKLIIDAL